MFKYKISTEEHSALEESLKAFYQEGDDGFTLLVEGATSKDKVSEFRSNNIKLQDDLKKFDGVDMDKYTAMLETERKVRNKELIDKGEFDTLLAENMTAKTSDFEAKLSALQNKFEMSENNNSSLITKYEIEGAAHKAFSTHKIQPEAQAAIMAQINGMFTVNAGSVVAMEGDTIKVGADGNYTVDEFVSSQPDFMKVQSEGGAGTGATNVTPPSNGMANRRAAYSKLLS